MRANTALRLARYAAQALAAAALAGAPLPATPAGTETPAAASPLQIGESIYLHGVLPGGAPLVGLRPQLGVDVRGGEAACVNCHQRSGLGTYEGYNLSLTIPPVAGRYLFRARAAVPGAPALPYVEWMRGDREPYTDATLARAIREGVDTSGRPMKPLMPHFRLADSDMAAVIEYLRHLGERPAPGVTDTVLDFATIVAPGTDPARRRAMLDVLQRYFDEKNQFPIGNSRQMHTSARTGYAKSMFMSHRLWKLHVWELQGPPSDWQEQLERFQAQEPVLAVVSGLGGGTWTPVQRFCEHAALPCLFPNVEVPVDDDQDFYSLYFSRGVLLEAGLIAAAIADGRAATVAQIYRPGDSGESAAPALAAALAQHGIAVRSIALSGPPGQGLDEALRGAGGASALVLWVRAGDLAALGASPPVPERLFLSGLMAGLEHAPVPAAWRGRIRIAYPYDLPQNRELRLRYPLSWFAIQHIPVVDEQLQVNTFLACGLLAETLSHMADNFDPAFLVELLQASVEHRLVNTGYFPRLGLGTNQHFASKGGYIAHFDLAGDGAKGAAAGVRLVADGGWSVP